MERIITFYTTLLKQGFSVLEYFCIYYFHYLEKVFRNLTIRKNSIDIFILAIFVDSLLLLSVDLPKILYP